jgi:hypothetical protein
MNWRYTTNRDRLVADGNVFKVYEAAENRMYWRGQLVPHRFPIPAG